MADLAELHEEVACLFGPVLALVRLARRAGALAHQENEGDLVAVLERLEGAGEQVQHRCQLLVARHTGLRVGRITATSRKVRAGVLSRCGEGATLHEVLALLTVALDLAQVATAGLAAGNPPNSDEAVTDFAEFALLVWKSTPVPYPEPAPGSAGDRFQDPGVGKSLA